MKRFRTLTTACGLAVTVALCVISDVASQSAHEKPKTIFRQQPDGKWGWEMSLPANYVIMSPDNKFADQAVAFKQWQLFSGQTRNLGDSTTDIIPLPTKPQRIE